MGLLSLGRAIGRAVGKGVEGFGKLVGSKKIQEVGRDIQKCLPQNGLGYRQTA